MDSFSFTIPQNIKFGAGTLDLLPDLAKELGKSKGYIISGPHLEQESEMVAKVPEGIKKCRHGKRNVLRKNRRKTQKYRLPL